MRACEGRTSPDPPLRGSASILVCLVPARGEGGALIILPADEQQEWIGRIRTFPLPRMSAARVREWLVRRGAGGEVLGGWQCVQGQNGILLLRDWIRRAGGARRELLLTLPFHAVADAVPGAMGTLRRGLRWMVECWRAEADVLSGGGPRQQAVAQTLRRRLALPLGELLDQGILVGELSGFLYEAELEVLLPQLGDVIMSPLRQQLTELGFEDPEQPIALLAHDSLGQLPLQSAPVSDPRSGKQVPFEKTCRMSLNRFSP